MRDADEKTLPPRPTIFRQLVAIALLTAIGMTIFESVKQAIHPRISIWESHVVTIFFSAIVAAAAGTIVLRRIHAAHLSAVNEMRKTEAERAGRLASLGTLATGLAHEIKNPLAAILTSAQAARNLKDRPDSDEKLKQSLQNVVDSAMRCNEIVDKLRAFGGGRPAEMQASNLNEVARNAVESSRAFCESRQARIELALQDDLLQVMISSVQIEMLLVNLICNAAQAAETGVLITIRTERTRDGVRLAVQDNGRGISEEAKRRAFEPFYSTRHNEGGMGLGLSIAHGIVVNHLGSINIDGAVGKGTTVTVELPAAG